jgi:hypothetical protein
MSVADLADRWALERAAIGRYAVVGGIAVATRPGEAHRATIDLDAVVDDLPRGPSAVEARRVRGAGAVTSSHAGHEA